MTTETLNLPEFTDGQDNPDTTINEALNVFDVKHNKVLTIDIGADADLSITASGSRPQQWQHAGFEITDTGANMSTGRNVVLPNNEQGIFFFYNNTGGGHALTLTPATGSGIAVADTKRAILECDGSNVVRWTGDL